MAQIAKIEAKADIKCLPAKAYGFFKNDMIKIVEMLPQVFKSAQLIEGKEGQAGNVKLFQYVLGKQMSAKVKCEEVDDEKRSVTFSIVEGDILEVYKSFMAKVTFSDGYVNWNIEFGKANESVPIPDKYVALAVEITKGLDLYLLAH